MSGNALRIGEHIEKQQHGGDANDLHQCNCNHNRAQKPKPLPFARIEQREDLPVEFNHSHPARSARHHEQMLSVVDIEDSYAKGLHAHWQFSSGVRPQVILQEPRKPAHSGRNPTAVRVGE
ncbi:hypothetical protein [Hyphomicrobium sp.]|uniref:hypothetical protein n=1 Tax=Hyphomicrobium sp. TaxID=82 RepID=UPI002FE29E99